MLFKAVLFLGLTFAFYSCSENDEELPNRYSCGLDQEKIMTSYYVYNSEDDMYEIFLSRVADCDIYDNPSSYILIRASAKLLMSIRSYDLLDMPSDVEDYELSITIIHNSTYMYYNATKSSVIDNTEIELSGIDSGTITLGKQEDKFIITINIAESGSTRVLCTFEDVITEKTF